MSVQHLAWDRVLNQPATIYTPPEDTITLTVGLDECHVCGKRVTDFEDGGYEREDGQRGHFACDATLPRLVNPAELRLSKIECEHCDVVFENPTDEELRRFNDEHPPYEHQKETFSPSAQQWAIAHRIMAHAYEHYDEGGWDVLVECHDAESVAQMIWNGVEVGGEPITTFEDALADIWSCPVSVWADREADAENSRG